MESGNTSKPQHKRKFGFKESRDDIKKRLQEEKKEKWKKKVSQENPEKLNTELQSLCKASYLSPPQKERKRLVEKMLQEMNSVKKNSEAEKKVISSTASPPTDGEKAEDFSVIYENFTEGRNDLFVPRSLRKEEKRQVSFDKLAEIAEKNILGTSDHDEEDLDDFLNSL